MNSLKLARYFPCGVFFSQGRPLAGVIALMLQATLIFWPVAARWATLFCERSGIERLLGELSESNRLAADPYAAPAKKFRQLA